MAHFAKTTSKRAGRSSIAARVGVGLLAALLLAAFLPIGGSAKVASAAGCPPELDYGSGGTWVQRLQGTLNAYYDIGDFTNSPYGFVPALAVDSSFGPQTQAAVKDYQSKHGLQVDGFVGPQTWGSLGFCVGNGNTGSVSGGGCHWNPGVVDACIAVNSNGYIIPDLYVYVNPTGHPDDVTVLIMLVEDGNQVASSTYGGTNTHIFGPLGYKAGSGHTWQEFVLSCVTGICNPHGTASPVQYS